MKKLCAFFCVISILVSVNVNAFNFPEPDWGALLRQKESMVKETDFELYVEGSVESALYYGARLEPKSGAYIGIIAENSEQFAPVSGYLTYVQDMWQDDLYYPANEIIRNGNAATMVGWTIDNIYNVNYDQVRKVLDTLNSYNKPMFIRFANEMNVSALGNDPNKYIEVFRTVADMIHQYPNFAVVWSPNDMGALDRPFEYFYPGDEYVDWIGVSCYSIKYFQGNQNTQYKDMVYFMTGDYAYATNRVKPIIEFMEKNNINKPLMISEGGVPTNNKFGEDLQSWASPRLRNMMYYLVMKYPQIKMVNYFNTHRANEAERFDISDYPYGAEIFNEAKNSGAYITEYGAAPEFVFKPASGYEQLTAENGIVPLYTLAYFANQDNITVNYEIDGSWYHSSNQIPYICNLDITGLGEGEHTVSISSSGSSKSYKFYKRGNVIRFNAEPENTGIRVTVNGNYIDFDTQPVIQNGRTLVPVRKIFEALGAEVEWDEPTQTVKATKGETTVILQINNEKMYVNGAEKILDVPAQLMESRTLVPARAVGEAFGCNVSWDDPTQTVIILY